jgi:hypothetical protein
MAVYGVVQQWVELRVFAQCLWQEVSYDSLNGPVAASLTNTAIAFGKQTCTNLFAEFSGHDSYESILLTITKGDLDKAQMDFKLGMYRIVRHGRIGEKLEEISLDVKEHFCVYVYNDLTTCLDDFRQNRTGKLTKSMRAKLDGWSPSFDLQHVINEERIA